MTASPDPQLSPQRFIIMGVLILTILLAGFGAWAYLGRISGAIVAMGKIELDRNREPVQHQTGGTVIAILVAEGDLVKSGQPLLQLDTAQLTAQRRIDQGQLIEIMARLARLQAEIDMAETPDFAALESINPHSALQRRITDGQTRLHRARLASYQLETHHLHDRTIQTNQQLRATVKQNRAVARQIALIGDELTAQQSLLARGLTQTSRVSALRRERARLEGQLGALDAQTAQLEGRKSDTEIELIQLGNRRREEAIAQQRDFQHSAFELRERRAALGLQIDRMTLRAPVSGIVHDLKVTALNAVVPPAEPVLFIIPNDRPLIVATDISARNIDRVFIGQSVRLRMSSLDRIAALDLVGKVARISADAYTNDRTGQSYYRVETLLDPNVLTTLSSDIRLLPGMPVETYLITQDRSPLSYLLKPVNEFFARALRE